MVLLLIENLHEIVCTSDAKLACPTRPCGSGGNAGVGVSSPSKTSRDRVGHPSFPPADIAEAKAAACETVRETKLPLSKQATVDLACRLPERIGKSISRSTVFRILDSAATKPWQHRSWIFLRTADFAEKAAMIFELYQGMWDGEPLGSNDYVLSADGKTSIRCHDSLPVQIGRPLRVESEFVRGGALQYLAAWDVHRAKVFGRRERGDRHPSIRTVGGQRNAAVIVRLGGPRVPDCRQRFALPGRSL